MNSLPNTYNKLLVKFRRMSADVNRRIANGTINELEARERAHLFAKMRAMFHRLRMAFSRRHLVRLMAAAGIWLGVTTMTDANAQTITFGPPAINPFGLDSAKNFNFPATADLDGDGDFDILSGEYYGQMVYYQNIGTATAPAFAAADTVNFGFGNSGYIATPTFADLDGDGDFDMLRGAYYGSMEYFENTGSATAPSFGAAQVNPFGLDSVYYFAFPQFVDLDDDGDMDLLVNEYYGNYQYFENTGTANAPAFAAAQTNPFNLQGFAYYNAFDLADLDMDGDMDILFSGYPGEWRYQENIGTASAPNFGPVQLNPFSFTNATYLGMPKFVDLDGDGDMDLLHGSYYGHWTYYENTSTISGINDPSFAGTLEMGPVPATDRLTIDTESMRFRGEGTLSVVDMQGKLHQQQEIMIGSKVELEVAGLPAGIYLVQLNFNGKQSSRKFVKQ